MEVGGPKFWANGTNAKVGKGGDGDGIAVGDWHGEIIHEGIEPDVCDVSGIEGNGNSPAQARGRARDAEVFECFAFEEAEDFVAAIVGLDKRGIRLDVIDQPLL